MEVRKVLRSNPSLIDRMEKSSALELGRGRLLMSRKARVPRIMYRAGADRAQVIVRLTEGRVACDQTPKVARTKSRLEDVLVTRRSNPQSETTAGLDRVALHNSRPIDCRQDIDGGSAIQ